MKSSYIFCVLLVIWVSLVAHSCSEEKTAKNSSSNDDLATVNVDSIPSARHDLNDADLDLQAPSVESLSNKDWKSTDVQIITRENGEMTVEGIFQERNINAYRQGGYFDCRNFRSRDCGKQKIRDFVWECWTTQKRGYVRSGWSGIDVGGTTHIFIEPNEHDEWTAVLREVKVAASMGPAYLLTETTSHLTIDRTTQKTKNGMFSLVFKNRDNETIRTFRVEYFGMI